ncbi:MAG TPA: DUF4271 domain-containing protein [Tenuifilaceae bacterium]|nr:DUF4271 domain-containing protein [Tenuifilaceae bacterium]HPJ44843.1 DUF4271 domain-containing protein [Tenuifilaceae bacterium]HPQ32863.1 DUF4271 domain-containing protein [Tenuifilaceae bacterium]HRX67208.1 DUF4271 domain-containing protein [Tenuifilaceae bacterium]
MLLNKQNISLLKDTIATKAVVNQLDSIPVPNHQDSLEAFSLGVDPIFIMNERKTKEVREYKIKQVEAQKRKLIKERPIKDTTCIVCPKGIEFPFYETIVNLETKEATLFFDKFWLFDKSDNQNNTSLHEQIFVETKQIKEHPIHITATKINAQSSNTENCFFLVIMLALATVSVLRVYSYGYLKGIIQAAFSLYNAGKIHRDGSLMRRRVHFILDANMFLITSLLFVYIIDYFHFSIPLNTPKWILVLVIFSALVSFYLIKRILLFAIANLSQTKAEIKELTFNQSIYTRILGLVLVPLAFILFYSQGLVASIVLYTLLVTVIIALIMRITRTFQLFISKGFSIFYFVLYLCALEITPLLIVVKEVMM